METKLVNANSIKPGSYVMIDGVACRTLSAETSKSGKHGSAKTRITAVGLLDGKKREIVMGSQDNIEVPIIEKKTAQVLSITGNTANVMDEETYETFDLEIPEELKDSVAPNCTVLYWKIMGEKVMKQIKKKEN
ncbi:translation initiation factor IF-5A [Candidatus Woesearchaeota archaeon]|nr:MAG: translation initiation factor IF-5A [Candidatus Woesearchaeota archaeon ex4484_78]RLE46758.1 MAG: translation initiation factor IF-5A [Candidatus Woesearchaeota archaeon]